MKGLIILLTDLVVTLQKQQIDPNRKLRRTIYDAVYNALSYMNVKYTPITLYGITNNPNTLKILVEKELIEEVTDKKQIIVCKRGDVKHYKVSSKGHRYMKVYNEMMELL